MLSNPIKLILTADYEVFGNGSGCVQKCVIEPADQMMKIVEKHGFTITFFVDVCEYWAFRETENKNLFEKGYSPAKWMEKQWKDAIKRGHDVQLHFHPQWLEYEYSGNKQWKLNYDLWRLPAVNDHKHLFQKGKSTLEELLKPVNPNYKCNVFRAGAWCIQPEEEILKAMRSAGIYMDSTVAPKLAFDNDLTKYNFSNAPVHLPFWKINNNVIEPDPSGEVIEIPIYTAKLNTLDALYFKLLILFKKIPSHPSECSGTSLSAQNRSFVLKQFRDLIPKYKMFNFCHVSFEEMKFFIKDAKNRYSDTAEEIPVVAIGHPNNFANERELDSFLAWCRAKGIGNGQFKSIY